MTNERKVANPLALAVLAWLTLEPMHPYELSRRLEESKKDRSIKYNRGSLYMVVRQLRKAGFIAEQETVRDTQRPERTVYALTDDGRREAFDWMRELLTQPQHEYPQFGVALSLISMLPPSEAAELLSRRLEALTVEQDELRTAVDEAAASGLAWIFQVEDEYRLTLLAAEERYVAELIESLKRPDYHLAWQQFFGGQR